MSTIRHAHSSSLYSASPQSLADQVERAVEATDPNATVLTLTEVGSRQRTKVLKQADRENWGAWVPDESDVGIMWRRENFKVHWREATKLTDLLWTDGHGRRHETWAGTMFLEHRDEQTLFLSVSHLPSHVQDGDDFHNNAQARAWKDAVNGWRKYWRQKQKTDKPDLSMVVADWNVDFHVKDWRAYVGHLFDPMRLCWAGDQMPAKGKGTHGPRLIDATYTTGKVQKAVLLKDDKSSDHRPYGEAIKWPNKQQPQGDTPQ